MDENDYKIYKCKSLTKKGIEVIYTKNGIEGFQSLWNLIIRKVSTWEDLEQNHHLEEVGQTIWETILEISHCPYCGVSLNFGDGACKGNFVHLDRSGWSLSKL